MEKDLRLSLETVKALRSHIYTAKTDDGKDCMGLYNKNTYLIMLCDIWEMLYLLLQDSDNQASKRD